MKASHKFSSGEKCGKIKVECWVTAGMIEVAIMSMITNDETQFSTKYIEATLRKHLYQEGRDFFDWFYDRHLRGSLTADEIQARARQIAIKYFPAFF